MSVREKGRKKIKQETSTQYKVTDPISMADLEHIHLRKGRSYPSKPPPMSTKTWEEVRREKEERILKARRERALSTPLETTSTDAMDMEEAQVISKEIAEKAAERELKKQKYAQYQRTKQTANRLHTLEGWLTSLMNTINTATGTELAPPSTSGKPTPPPRRDSIPMLELNVTQQTIQETVKDMDRQGSKIRRYKKYLQKQAAENQK